MSLSDLHNNVVNSIPSPTPKIEEHSLNNNALAALITTAFIMARQISGETFSCNKDKKSITTLQLTPREIDCINLLKKAFTVKDMARALSLSPRTVEDYINKIKKKLGCHRKAQILIQLND